MTVIAVFENETRKVRVRFKEEGARFLIERQVGDSANVLIGNFGDRQMAMEAALQHLEADYRTD